MITFLQLKDIEHDHIVVIFSIHRLLQRACEQQCNKNHISYDDKIV